MLLLTGDDFEDDILTQETSIKQVRSIIHALHYNNNHQHYISPTKIWQKINKANNNEQLSGNLISFGKEFVLFRYLPPCQHLFI